MKMLLALALLSSPPSYGVYVHKFHLENRGAVKSQCFKDNQPVNSKIFVSSHPEAPLEQLQRTNLKLRVCIQNSLHKMSFENYLPKILWDNEKLLQMAVHEQQLIKNVPSTKKPGQFVEIQLTRLPHEKLLWGKSTLVASAFLVSWSTQKNEDKPEYPDMKLYVTEPDHLTQIPGFTVGLPPWARLELTFNPPLIGTLHLRGFIGEIEWLEETN